MNEKRKERKEDRYMSWKETGDTKTNKLKDFY